MHDLAVVPIVVNAGAAVLPTVMAALAGVAAMVLHPKNLVQAVRRRPWMTSTILASLVAGIFLVPRGWRAISRKHPATSTRSQAALQIDWAKVAEDILEEERRRELNSVAPPTPATPSGPSSPAPPNSTPVVGVLHQDFSRAFAEGDRSPAGLVSRWKYYPETA